MQRRAIVVLGAHRSGTSALTRVLNLAGAYIPENVLPPVPGNNDRGFWEPVELVAASEHAFAAVGISWDDPRRVPPGWFDGETAEHYVHELARFLERNFAGRDLFVLKDPRLCRIVPLLRRALERCRIEAGFALSLRHPAAVAASLGARDRLATGHGLALWLRYMLDAERWTRDAPRLVVGFDDVMADWRAVLARVASRLGVPLEQGGAADAIGEFLEPELVHHAHEAATLPPHLQEVWSCFRRMRAADAEPTDLRMLDAVTATLDAAEELTDAGRARAAPSGDGRREKALEHELELKAGELARLAGELARLNARQDEQTVLISELRRRAGYLEHRMRFSQSMAQMSLERACGLVRSVPKQAQ